MKKRKKSTALYDLLFDWLAVGSWMCLLLRLEGWLNCYRGICYPTLDLDLDLDVEVKDG